MVCRFVQCQHKVLVIGLFPENRGSPDLMICAGGLEERVCLFTEQLLSNLGRRSLHTLIIRLTASHISLQAKTNHKTIRPSNHDPPSSAQSSSGLQQFHHAASWPQGVILSFRLKFFMAELRENSISSTTKMLLIDGLLNLFFFFSILHISLSQWKVLVWVGYSRLWPEKTDVWSCAVVL